MSARLLMFAVALVAACNGSEPQVEAPPPPPPAPVEAVKPPPPPAPPQAKPLAVPEGVHPALLDPKLAVDVAPATFKVKVNTTKGPFVILVNKDWAPLGADRFYNLVRIGFYNDARFFRAVDGFMVQWGISPYPDVSAIWREAQIKDDPVKESNTRGRITFATAGPNTRTTQLFINYGDNSNLDGMGFSPFGEVVEGMDVVDSLYKGYGEGAPRGRGPRQDKLQRLGNSYLDAEFDKLDGIVNMELLTE